MLASLFLSLLTLASDSTRLTGQCYSVADQRVLKCHVTVISGTDNRKISSDKSGNFGFNLPASAKALNFDAAGFESRIIDINRVGGDLGKGTFNIKIPMLQNGLDPTIKEDETLFPRNQLFLNVEAPDSVTMHVLLMDEIKRNVAEHRPLVSPPKHRNLTINYIMPGPYELLVGTLDSTNKLVVDVVSPEKVTLHTGFNFLSVRYQNPAKSIAGNIALLTPRTLYFDQSSYQLRRDSKLVLDSVCNILIRRHNLIAKVTGHTDNVGRRNLNLILSEYRARVVQNYMKMNGVKPGQIQLAWKGPDEPVAGNDREENKMKNRRVELRFVSSD